jgi:hypothetical protein
VNDWKCHFERVENAVASGTPDVDYCISGSSGKLELKYAQKHPAKQTTPVLGRGNGLRRSQIVWIARRLHAGGRVFVGIGTPKTTWIIDTKVLSVGDLASLDLLSPMQLREISVWLSDSHPWNILPIALVK